MSKKFGLLMLILGVGVLYVPTIASAGNVNTFTIPELPSVPIIDGDLSDAVWANVPVIPMDKDGDSPAATPGKGELDIVLKVAWDDETNALFFGLNVIDDAWVSVRGMGSSAGNDGYNSERLEIILDGTNSGSADSTTTSGYHQQYCFDMPNTWDPWEPTNDIKTKKFLTEFVGYFSADQGGVQPSTTFIDAPVFERIQGTLDLDNTHSPWDVADEFCQSAAKIRVTKSGLTSWVESPVEFNWEVKIVPFAYLMTPSNLGYDIADPANIANGWVDLFKDAAQEKVDMKEGVIIGFTAQQNDVDIWDQAPARIHQTNTVGFSATWNSSENLSGLILGAKATTVPNWELQ